MWNHGQPYDFYSQNHRPETIVALSAGLLALGVSMFYRAVRGIWEAGK